MDKDTIIHTIRHGKTDFNLEKRYAGSIDIPLNEVGREDCRQASKALAGTRFDLVITSTLKRSIESARLLVGDNIQTIQCAFCNERDYGSMQGLTEDEVETLEPRICYIKVGGDYHSLNPPNGETFEDLRERARKLNLLILENYAGSSVLVVAHGVFLQQFHGLLRGQDWQSSLARSVPNLVLTSFELRGSTCVRETDKHLIQRDQSGW